LLAGQLRLIYFPQLSIFDYMGLPPLTPLPAPAYLVSDAHLGAGFIRNPEEQSANLDRLFDHVQQNGRSLVLAGDLFDFWYEWRQVIPKRYFHVLYRLRALTDTGVQAHYLAGNHDFRLHGFLEEEVGLKVALNALSADIGGRAVYIFHGDGILARDHGYRFMKRVFRARWAQRAFSWLHPDLAMCVARGTSITSRTVIKANPDDDGEYLAFARQKFAEGYSDVVLGHTHRPVEHGEGDRMYVNLGDWIQHFSYGLHDGQQLRLMRLSDS
jgi:UDP-2,3-diacylglucosamine hydrolase